MAQQILFQHKFIFQNPDRFVIEFPDSSFNKLVSKYREQWDAFKADTQHQLQLLFEDPSLQLVSIDPGSIRLQLQTYNIVGCFKRLISDKLQLPSLLDQKPHRVTIELNSRSLSEVPLLQEEVKRIETRNKQANLLQGPISPLQALPPAPTATSPSLTPEEVCRRLAASATTSDPEPSTLGLSIYDLEEQAYDNDKACPPSDSDSD